MVTTDQVDGPVGSIGIDVHVGLFQNPLDRFPERSLVEIDRQFRIGLLLAKPSSIIDHAVARLAADRFENLRELHAPAVQGHVRGFDRGGGQPLLELPAQAAESLSGLGAEARFGGGQQRKYAGPQVDQLGLGRVALGQPWCVELTHEAAHLAGQVVGHARFLLTDQ